jgi:hypothetical protein
MAKLIFCHYHIYDLIIIDYIKLLNRFQNVKRINNICILGNITIKQLF